MSVATPFKFKVCLVGEHAVGKTCLIRRYVFNEFSDSYICTIGAKATKKKLTVQHPKTKKPVDVYLLIWDITGQQGFRKLLQQAYFSGVQGIVAVCDNTRERTLPELGSWIGGIQDVTEEIPTVFLGNKCDLIEEQQISLNEIRSFASGYERSAAYLSSAKTGFNVELAFNIIGGQILKELL
ncbi:MAG: GTP-binding protein [Thermoplasmata archaeon]|nr:MAG: GTP-binding protein [Thermoplasmata archaeon]